MSNKYQPRLLIPHVIMGDYGILKCISHTVNQRSYVYFHRLYHWFLLIKYQVFTAHKKTKTYDEVHQTLTQF